MVIDKGGASGGHATNEERPEVVGVEYTEHTDKIPAGVGGQTSHCPPPVVVASLLDHRRRVDRLTRLGHTGARDRDQQQTQGRCHRSRPAAAVETHASLLGVTYHRTKGGSRAGACDAGLAGRYFFALPGGKSLNILSLAFPSFLMFFSALSDSSSWAMPRHIRLFDFASKMSTKSVPTVYS